MAVYTAAMPTAEDIIAVSHIVKDARKAIEPVLKPLEGEIRGELGMTDMARLSTMMLTYNMDKALSTEKAATNYIAMQNILVGAALKATKLNVAAQLPPEAKEPRVKDVLTALKADALLKLLGHAPASAIPGGNFGGGISFDD